MCIFVSTFLLKLAARTVHKYNYWTSISIYFYNIKGPLLPTDRQHQHPTTSAFSRLTTTMSDFPRLIEEAAKIWPNETAAFEQITLEANKIKIRIQAIDIMQQFVGDVSFGRGQYFQPTSIHACFNAKYFQTPRDSCFTKYQGTSRSVRPISNISNTVPVLSSLFRRTSTRRERETNPLPE